MRPIDRGPSPYTTDFDDYRKAFPDLVSRLGPYCSFSERRIPTNLAVEHIQPKALPAYAKLIGRWDNFLLACVNCNSTKGDRDVVLAEHILPDRDNSAAAFLYRDDGAVVRHPGRTPKVQGLAQKTLALCGLDKSPKNETDANGVLVATDRYRQRQEAWEVALWARDQWTGQPTATVGALVVELAVKTGYFSVWMAVFEGEAEMRRAFVEGFPGTAADCFDTDAELVTPRPKPPGLKAGGKC